MNYTECMLIINPDILYILSPYMLIRLETALTFLFFKHFIRPEQTLTFNADVEFV